eukprot:248988_1
MSFELVMNLTANGTYDEFNRKYPAITPFVLVLCVVIALQIFWRACHHSYLFQMVRNPSSLYTECTYWFWLSKAILLVIQTVGCSVYYVIVLHLRIYWSYILVQHLWELWMKRI